MNEAAWPDAWYAAALLAVDPQSLGGITIRARAGVVRDRWLERYRSLLPRDAVVRRLPVNVTDDRLLGGLDLASTLRSKRVIAETGILAATDGGTLVVSMAERLSPNTVSHLCRVLDERVVRVERDGIADRQPAELSIVAFDEGIDDEGLDAALLDRLAFVADLHEVSHHEAVPIEDGISAGFVATVRDLDVGVDDDARRALCAVALALGISSVRAPMLALRAARANALLSGRDHVEEEDVSIAARLVLAPKANQLPASSSEEQQSEPAPSEENESESSHADKIGRLEDRVLEAVRAALPDGVLSQLVAAEARGTARSSGPAGTLRNSKNRGRRIGSRRGEPRGGARLNVLETLRAAAPWQGLRGGKAGRVEVRGQDFRIHRYQERSETVTIFAVDASGSSAVQRLAEAKGAVEQVLADCYVRRDEVAMITFRDSGASLVLPPTKSLLRAKRTLAGVPGGGATPLAAGIEMALQLALDAQRRGKSPVLVFMTDGGANVARDGTRGRRCGDEDAKSAARGIRARGFPTLFVDIGPRPRPRAREIASEMNARYLHLPRGDGERIAQTVQSVSTEAR